MNEPQTKLTAIQTVMLREAGISVEEWEKATVSVEEFCRLFGIKHPLTNFMGEPQLSAETREDILDLVDPKVPYSHFVRVLEKYTQEVIATALEEQREKYLEQVRQLETFDQVNDHYGHYELVNRARVISILNGKE